MATRFDSATTDALRLSSGIFDYNAAYTIMAWCYPVSNPAADMQPFSVAVDGSNLDQLRTGSAATSWSVRSLVGGTAVASGTASVDYAVWQHLAMVRTDSANLYLYKDAAQSTASNQSVSGRSAATQLDAGNGRGGTTPLNGRLYAIKAWTAALSAAEIAAEMRSVRPVRLANLWGWWPSRPGTAERLKDYSGNGRSFTEIGTLSDEDPPPVAWGARPSKAGYSRPAISLAISRSSASTTPDVVALPTARGLSAAPASASTTPDVVGLPTARRLASALASASTTPDAVGLLRALIAALSLASTSTTPNTPALISLVPFAISRASASTTPDTAGLPIARRLSLAVLSRSVTPDLLKPWARYVFVVPTATLTSAARRTTPLIVPAHDRSSRATRTMTFTVAADQQTSEA